MNKDNVDVSIIIAAFNAGKYIEDTIKSILNQTYKCFELIIVNDGSKDNTVEKIKTIKDDRIQLISQNNNGQDVAFNLGFMHSTGDFIKFMDADDIINEKSIEIQRKALLKNPKKIAYGELYRFFGQFPIEEDIKGQQYYWRDMSPVDFLTVDGDGPFLQCGQIMLNKELINKSGLWNEDLILYNDTEFYTRVILNSEGIVFTPGSRLFYRSGHNTSLTSQNKRVSFESTYKAIELIAENLLAYENSPRVRKVIANMYYRRYYDIFPKFPDLAKKYKNKAILYGGQNLVIRGGTLYNFISATFGWKIAKLLSVSCSLFKKAINF